MDSKNYICNGIKFIYSRGYIGLPVKVAGIPETLVINGNLLHRKSTFHVSLLCVKDLVGNYKISEEKLLNEFCYFVNKNDISFIKHTGEFRLAEDTERKTLIVRCDVSNIDLLFNTLSEKYGVSIPNQPTHVTLYTLQPEIGIGLNTPSDMNTKSILVQTPPELENIKL